VSSALAIAGVTAVLRDLLNGGLINHNVSGILGSTVTVSALPPDRLVSTNGTEISQLNLFLHQVTPNLGWRNAGLPSRDGSGRNRLSNPPLALDLHYLLSAYGAEALHPEILLGYAMQLLHETPVLSRSVIRTALQPSPEVGTALPPALQALADSGLADQVEQIKITPEYLSTEEMSKLWTAVQSHCRPTAAYLVTVVLIESTRPTRATLPVLSRGPVDPATGRDRGVVVEPSLLPPLPTIESVVPASLEPAATVGATVNISGHHLDGTNQVIVLSNARFQIEQEVPALPGASSTTMQAVVPNIPVGIYQVAIRVIRPGESQPCTSNHLALLIGPGITTALPTSVARDGAGTATITLDCQPEVRPGQAASLLLGAREVFAEPFSAATSALTFVAEAAPVGEHLVRLRVDGIESAIINRTATPPVFLDRRITII
jgi:Pvc16 N-terminal domain/IPT/TIG domain